MGESETTYERSDLDQDDGCSLASSTLDSIVPDRMSPVQTKLKKHKLKANGFNNTTIQAHYVGHVQISGNVQDQPAPNMFKDGDEPFSGIRGPRFPEMENQDHKGSSTKRETGHLGYKLEPQETVDQLSSELGKDNQVLKQNSCEHLQGAGNDNGQELHEILKITMGHIERAHNVDANERMACEEKGRQKMETMQDTINELTKQKIHLEVERDYQSKFNALVEKHKNEKRTMQENNNNEKRTMEENFARLEHNHLLEKTVLEKRVTSSEQQNELLSKQKAELEQKLAISEDNNDRERLENNAMQDSMKKLEEEKKSEADKNAELERKVQQKDDELVTVRTEAADFCIRNAMSQRRVNVLERKLQHFEARDFEMRQIADRMRFRAVFGTQVIAGLRFLNQQDGEPNVQEQAFNQIPGESVDIFALRADQMMQTPD